MSCSPWKRQCLRIICIDKLGRVPYPEFNVLVHGQLKTFICWNGRFAHFLMDFFLPQKEGETRNRRCLVVPILLFTNCPDFHAGRWKCKSSIWCYGSRFIGFISSSLNFCIRIIVEVKFLQIEFNLIQYQFSGILDLNEIHLQRQVECADFENQLLISI